MTHPSSGVAGPVLAAEVDVPLQAPADRQALFRRLTGQHLEDAYRLAAAIVGDRREAEDATHDAIVRAWQAWGSLRSPEAFGAWFQRILVNVCRDRLRRARHAVRLPSAGPDAIERMGRPAAALERDAFAASAERDALDQALAGLDHDQRVVIAMRYFLDLPVDEIARRLGAPTGTVKSRLHRAIRSLRAAYDAAARLDTETSR